MLAIYFKKITILCSSIAFLYACGAGRMSQNPTEKYFEEGNYEKLIQVLKQNKNLETAPIQYKIAEAYRLSNRPLEAISYYKKAKELGSTERELLLWLAISQKMNGEYAQSKKLLLDFMKQDSVKADLLVLGKKNLNNLATIDSLNKNNPYFAVRTIEGLNSPGAEYAPMMYNGDLVFTASKKENIYANGLPYIGLYKTKFTSPEQTAAQEMFDKNIFDPAVNEGSITFHKDGKIAVFARGNKGGKKSTADVDLYMTKLENGAWSQPTLLSISDSLAWDSSPAFSADGKTLYFASNRIGGLGGIDIYRVGVDAQGRFGTPANMGKVINSIGNDMFPYAAKDGKLYLSSDGHPGLGGLDLFVAIRKNGKIILEHLGKPMNSPYDDFAITKVDQKNGYFSSNRYGGKGDDDIYAFEDNTPEPPVEKPNVVVTEKPKTVKYFLEGLITDNKGKALDSVKIQVLDENTMLAAGNSITIEDGKWGKFELETGTKYSVLIEKNGFYKKREIFDMKGKEVPQEKLEKPENEIVFDIKTILEQPTKNQIVNNIFGINTIFYNLDKADIRMDASVELDKAVQAMIDNPTVKIELGSHTDSRSSAEYNQGLSQRRATSAMNYMIEKGISPNRLRAKGYGESKLINKCADGVECTEEEHQANRRTEFRVIDIK